MDCHEAPGLNRSLGGIVVAAYDNRVRGEYRFPCSQFIRAYNAEVLDGVEGEVGEGVITRPCILIGGFAILRGEG